MDHQSLASVQEDNKETQGSVSLLQNFKIGGGEARDKLRKKHWNLKDSALRNQVYRDLSIKTKSEKIRINKEFADLFLRYPKQKIDVDHKKFDEYDYHEVIRPAVRRAQYFMMTRYGKQWTYTLCEQLLHLIFRNRVRRANFKPKADLKRALDRDQANLEMRQERRVLYGPEPKEGLNLLGE